MKPPSFSSFKRTIRSHYRLHGRAMRWREVHTPYYVVVSEIMLQQTQVPRVAVKFDSFIERFPDWRALAEAPTREVLQEWSGLGYNRRALYLKRIAEKVVGSAEYRFLKAKLREPIAGDIAQRVGASIAQIQQDLTRADEDRLGIPAAGILQRSLYESLLALPGIGPNTAASILAFAFNIPVPFIETNIRSVFIHFFFNDSKQKIPDSKLFPLIEKTLDLKEPREWYYALMDYGSYLKGTGANPSRKSAHHSRQKAFRGSNRELRSKILKAILEKPATIASLKKLLAEHSGKDIERNIRDLESEGFVVLKGAKYLIA